MRELGISVLRFERGYARAFVSGIVVSGIKEASFAQKAVAVGITVDVLGEQHIQCAQALRSWRCLFGQDTGNRSGEASQLTRSVLDSGWG